VKNRKLFSLLLPVLTILPGPALATTFDGKPGATSSGHVIIRMTNQNLIQISNLSDILLERTRNGDYKGGSDACIYRNAAGSYSLTAYGSGPGGRFEISDGDMNQLDYETRFSDGARTFLLSPGAPLTGLQNANTRSPRCTTGNNAAITIRIPASRVESAPAGNYVGGLTLIVAPE